MIIAVQRCSGEVKQTHIYCTVAKVRSLTGKIQIACFMYLTVRLRQVLSFQKQNDRDISQVVFYFEYYQTAQIGADFVRARETERPSVLFVHGRDGLLADRAKDVPICGV